MATDKIPDITWSGQFAFHPRSTQRRAPTLPGDKIVLPPSALEGLLSAASTSTANQVDIDGDVHGNRSDDDDDEDNTGPSTSTFDPFNPYSFAAERTARAQLRVAKRYRRREQRQQRLPHPLTFRLLNPINDRVVFAGIQEFSADEGEVVLSAFLQHALGIKVDEDDRHLITVHARQLPKGSYVRLRPLEAGYDVEDWKSLLEQHLRSNFTTLTTGELLTVPGMVGRAGGDHGGVATTEEFRFLVDRIQPATANGICIVDTDLEVDIEPLNEEQARETLQRRLVASKPGDPTGVMSSSSSSPGGIIVMDHALDGQVQDGEYVDYQLSSWDRSRPLEVELDGVNAADHEVDLLISPYSSRQRARPREDQHVLGDLTSHYPKRIYIPAETPLSDTIEAIWISVHGYSVHDGGGDDDDGEQKTSRYKIRISYSTDSLGDGHLSPDDDDGDATHHVDEIKCRNCRQWVPTRTMMLHENFCLRNNIICDRCGKVFKKSSSEWTHHWHCPHNVDGDDGAWGITSLSRVKHDRLAHTPSPCRACSSYTAPNMALLARHRTTTCPAKLIICRFCHLLVPQGGSSSVQDNILTTMSSSSSFYPSSVLTPHEFLDGARTTECHLCQKIVRLRDLSIHLRHHDLVRRRRPRPRICRNVNCSRLLSSSSSSNNNNNTESQSHCLCALCFGPLYVSMYDPDGKALRRRVERRYLSQILKGCGNAWCRNSYCQTGHLILKSEGKQEDLPTSTKEAAALIQPFLSGFSIDPKRSILVSVGANHKTSPLHFCVDEQRQTRRSLANALFNGLHLLSSSSSSSSSIVPPPISSDHGDHHQIGPQGNPSEERSTAPTVANKTWYALEWYLAAIEACTAACGGGGGDIPSIMDWLRDHAPTLAEEEQE